MFTNLIKIGNSKGVRIPKSFLEECHLIHAVNLSIQDHKLIITPYDDPRIGWEEAFFLMSQQGEDTLLDPENISTSWDKEEWQW